MINTEATTKRINPQFISINFNKLITPAAIKDIRTYYTNAKDKQNFILYFNINTNYKLTITDSLAFYDKSNILHIDAITINKSNNKHLNQKIIKILQEYLAKLKAVYQKQKEMTVSELANTILANPYQNFMTHHDFLIWLTNHFDQIKLENSDYDYSVIDPNNELATFLLGNMQNYDSIDISAFNLILDYIDFQANNATTQVPAFVILQNKVIDQLLQKQVYFKLRQSKSAIDYHSWIDILYNNKPTTIKLPLSAILHLNLTDHELLEVRVVFQPFNIDDIRCFMTGLLTTDYTVIKDRIRLLTKLHTAYDCTKYQQEITDQFNKLPIIFNKNAQKVLFTLKNELLNK